MIRKSFCALLAVLLMLSLTAQAEVVGFNPPAEWWGMSKTAFTEMYKDEKFTETEIDGRKALVLSSVPFTDDLTLDVYFCFFEKAAGKSYYGLSEITYMAPLGSKKYTDSQLNKLYKALQEVVISQNGRPDEAGSAESVWYFDQYTITLAAKSFRKYNGSSNKTAAVTYVENTVEASENTGTQSARSKSGSLTVTPKAVCNDYNHVGDNWNFMFYINDTRVSEGKSMTFSVGDTVTVKARITEGDSNPDTGTNSATHVITAQDLQEGFKVRFTVEVKENGGRYNGFSAKWTVTFTFSN